MKELKWPITKDMVGTVVVFKGFKHGHKHWRFTVGKEYVIEKHELYNAFGVCDDDGDMPKENYDNSFMFEIVAVPVPISLKWYQRLLNWLKGV